MIVNENQYRITRREIERFEQAIRNNEREVTQTADADREMAELIGAGLRSQLETLCREVREYEALRDSAAALPDVEALEQIPSALIRGRISAGLTQKQLAERLGIKVQQVQRYEATRYASASLRRITEVARAISSHQDSR